MRCKSCTGEVPPKFSHAILTNICPLCGEEIMDAELQSALKDLKSAMNAVVSYPEEIFDWLKSNYGLHSESDVALKVQEAADKAQEKYTKAIVNSSQKNASFKPQTFEEQIEQVKLDKNGNQVAGPSLQSSEQTNKFFKNAQATKSLNSQAHFKNIVKQIKKSGSPALMDESGTEGVITPDMAESMGEVDPQELAELRAAFGDDSGPVSGLDSSEDSYDDEVPDFVLNMGKGNSGNMNQRDLAKLQNLQGKSAIAKSEMSKTGSVGLIRR